MKKENKYYYEKEKIIDEIKFDNENLLKVKLEYNIGESSAEKNKTHCRKEVMTYCSTWHKPWKQERNNMGCRYS